MWILQSIYDADKVYHLISEKEYTVGRKDTDIECPDDSSVSRNHGNITVTNDQKLVVTDKSKFGLFYSEAIEEDTEVKDMNFIKLSGSHTITTNGYIRFGIVNSIFFAKRQEEKIFTSLMKPLAKMELSDTLSVLGFTLVDEWQDDVTYLVMNKLLMNIKVTTALAFGSCNLVTPKYFDDLLMAIQQSNTLPDVEKYLPVLAEDRLESCFFKVNSARKELFRGKTFVFFDKIQMLKFKPPICGTSGTALLVESSEFTMSVVNDLNTLVISPKNPDDLGCFKVKRIYNQIKKELAKLGRRFIEDHELAVAILHCSAEIHCNPQFDMSQINSSLLSQRVMFENSRNTLKSSIVPASPNMEDDTKSLQPSSHPPASSHPPTSSPPAVVEVDETDDEEISPPPPVSSKTKRSQKYSADMFGASQRSKQSSSIWDKDTIENQSQSCRMISSIKERLDISSSDDDEDMIVPATRTNVQRKTVQEKPDDSNQVLRSQNSRKERSKANISSDEEMVTTNSVTEENQINQTSTSQNRKEEDTNETRKKNEVEENDEENGESLVKILVTPLLCSTNNNQPRTTQHSKYGKTKNFKTFRKVHPRSAGQNLQVNSLEIIGGSDLIPHTMVRSNKNSIQSPAPPSTKVVSMKRTHPSRVSSSEDTDGEADYSQFNNPFKRRKKV